MSYRSCIPGLGMLLCLALVMTTTPTQSWAQGTQTGTMRGTARDTMGLMVAGVTVTVRSSALQGSVERRSNASGQFEILGLPPGDYTVTFTGPGFATAEQSATVPLGGIVEVHAALEPATVVESVDVVAVVPSPLASTETSINLGATAIERLPLGRDLFRIAELAPGLSDNAPSANQLTISGAFGYDNLFLINGVDVNDNIFGTANDLYIEDAIEEAQVLTSGISAEYGRFSGGVVNAITKSGGNRFSGSMRANLFSPDWTARTPFETERGVERTGSLSDNTTYETTLGGPIVSDRLWFFYANRVQRESETAALAVTGADYARALDNDRHLLKLTGTVSPGHRLEGTYVRNTSAERRASFPFTIDPAAVIDRTVPNDLVVATYRGAVSSSIFTEFQVSRREFGFRNNGGLLTERRESPFLTLTQQFGHYNAPYFDANDPQDRNNRQFTGSATYYVSSHRTGTHSVKGGFEHFRSTLVGGNSQSATGFVYSADYAVGPDGAPLRDADGRLVPVFTPFANLIQDWSPIRGATLDVDTLSFYLSDTWAPVDRLTLTLGVRTENVRSEATGGVVGVETTTLVPRLAAAFDPHGDGRYVVHATYGHYAGRYSEAQFNRNTNVGFPNALFGVYTGPAGQGRDFAPGFDPANYMTVAAFFPTRNVFFDDDLSSPLTKELTVGAGASVGSRGYTRLTYVHRTTGNLIDDFFTLDGGATTILENGQNFGTFTNQVFRNADQLERQYDALVVQSHVNVTDRFLVDGSWTIQINNDGNFEGEDLNQPAIPSAAFDYPEITPADRYFPYGRLNGFQRHKVRVWGVYALGLGEAGELGIGGLWRYDSGQAYSLRALNQLVSGTQQMMLDSLGYPSGPSARPLYFSEGRGSETFDGTGLFDVSLQYSVPVWESLRPWVKLEVFNLFNNDTQIRWDTTVVPDPESPLDALGLPTGYVRGPSFGQPTSPNDFPQYLPGFDGLRSVRLAMGFRF